MTKYLNKSDKRIREACNAAIARWAKYNKLEQQIKTIQKVELNFDNSKYAFGKKYYFPFSLSSAKTIVKSCIFTNNTFDLLQTNYFGDELALYSSGEIFEDENPGVYLNTGEQACLRTSAYAQSGLTQKDYFITLQINDWSYVNFVTSATFFYLQKIHSEHLAQDQIKVFSQLKAASGNIGLILLSPEFGNLVFETIENTNSFTKFYAEWIYGFVDCIKYTTSGEDNSIQNPEKFNDLINTYFLEDFSNVRYYLYAFSSIIPNSLVEVCSAYCIDTRSISLIYYVLRQYQNILEENLAR